jgi:hypothetical protein
MKKSKKHSAAIHSGSQHKGFTRSEATQLSSPRRGLFGSGYTITEDVLM